MEQIQFENRINNLDTQTDINMNQTNLEDIIGLQMVYEIDLQLQDIAQVMQNQISQTQELREEVNYINDILSNNETTVIEDETYVLLSEEEANKLMEMGVEGITQDENGNYIVPEKNLTSMVEAKKNEISNLNSVNEITSLQLQSLVNQRSQSLTLASNLMNSNNEVLMAITRNIKG